MNCDRLTTGGAHEAGAFGVVMVVTAIDQILRATPLTPYLTPRPMDAGLQRWTQLDGIPKNSVQQRPAESTDFGLAVTPI